MGVRYIRASTSPSERCPSCAEPVWRLRWGHEERCERFHDARRAGLVRIGLTLLVLSLAFLSMPAHAQGAGDAAVVADGLAKNPLAWMVLGLLFAVGWLAKALITSFNERMAEQKAAHEQTIATLTSVVTLSLKQTEGLDVLDRAIDRFTQREG